MFFQSVKMAWHAVTANKLRTFLTMLGIIIGVVALIVLVSIADGASGTVTDEISDMGSSYLTVTVNDDKENPLRLSDMSFFSEPDEVKSAAPVAQTSVTAKSGYTSSSMTVIGTTGSYKEIQNLKIADGRFLRKADVDNHSYVIILSYDTAIELLGRADVVGESIALNGKSFLVAGVLQEDSSNSVNTGNIFSESNSDEDSSTVMLEGYIPFSTLTRISDNILDITSFLVSATDDKTLDYAEKAVTDKLLDRFENDEDAFSVSDQSQILDTMENVNKTMSLMIGGIAAISLLVGGIGIMNIMLVSVTERTREIGIRKAIGAKKGIIMMQFLLEALMLSIMGCFTGVFFSAIILKIIGLCTDSIKITMNMKVVLISVGFSAAVGVLFGLYPAGKAAGKKPIDALRYSG